MKISPSKFPVHHVSLTKIEIAHLPGKKTPELPLKNPRYDSYDLLLPKKNPCFLKNGYPKTIGFATASNQ